MKVRDSGMPEEHYWETLFDVPLIIDRLTLAGCGDVAEFGCGFGTFTIPIAKVCGGKAWTFDVDPAMIARTRQRAAGIPVICELKDVMEQGFGVLADAVLLFNILHCERPVELLRHAANALKNQGRVVVIHWRYGETPRGPSLDIRPKPEQVIEWARDAVLIPGSEVIDLPPWHYGLVLQRSRVDPIPSPC